MTFGERVYEELRRRSLGSVLLYADIQALKAVEDAGTLHRLLEARGHGAGPERTDPLHFADWIEILVLRRKAAGAHAMALLFAIT